MADNEMGGRPFLRIDESSKPVKAEIKSDPDTVRVMENETLNVPDRLKATLGAEDGARIVAPKYVTTERGPMRVSYAVIGNDYYYQLELAKPPNLDPRNTLGSIIQACASVIPSSIQTYISEPPPDINLLLYTVVAKEAATLIGAKDFMEKKLVQKLLDLRLWG